MIYLELFYTFLKIGLFSIGGGLTALGLMQDMIVEANGWLTQNEFADIVTLSQMTPGPIAINAATFVGAKIGGFFGSVVCTFSWVLPSVLICFCLALLYKKYGSTNPIQGILFGLRPAVAAVIISAGLSIFVPVLILSEGMPTAVSDINVAGVVIFAAAFAVLKLFRAKPIYIILGCGAVGFLYYYVLPLLTA